MKIYTFDNKIMTLDGKWMEQPSAPPGPPPGPQPPTLPPYTLRLKYFDGDPPSNQFGTVTQVSSSPNIWDLHYEGEDWTEILSGDASLIEIVAGNLSGVRIVENMCGGCENLTAVNDLFGTSGITNAYYMFSDCAALITVPLFNTTSMTNVGYMFVRCFNVESGALALYNQMSTQANPPIDHNRTFFRCGRDTVTGAAELAQIPASWGGTME